VIHLSAPPKRVATEPTIALINIVFLMLIFFLIAGTIAPPMPPKLDSVSTSNAPPTSPPNALAVAKDGTLYWRADTLAFEAFLSRQPPATTPKMRVIADRQLPATELLDLVTRLRVSGYKNIELVTEREQ